MGIRFFCPNGHKLNVKSFLGGKRAICPKCGAKVLVPLGETAGAAAQPGPGNSPPPVGDLGGADSVGSDSEIDPFAYDAALAVFTAEPTGNATRDYSPANANFASQQSPAQPPATNMIDPIDEAPGAVWYVRPPSGGQFGPAAGPTMRAWINEGRVTPNSLVWRDGWPEWRSAAATFPGLAGGHPAWGGGHAAPGGMPMQPGVAPGMPQQHAPMHGMMQPSMAPRGGVAPIHAAPIHAAPIGAAPMGAGPAGMPVGAAMPTGQVVSALEAPLGDIESAADDMLSRRKRHRKKGPDVTMYISVALVVMTILLVVVLTIVLMNQSDETPAAPAGQKHSEGTKQKPKKPAAPEEETSEENM